MTSLASTFLLTAAVSALLTLGVRRVAARWGVYDDPDGGRKRHPRRVPLWGGVAVYVAMSLGLMLSRAGAFGAGSALDDLAAVVIATAGFVCFFGCIDDYCRLRPRFKLLLQSCSVLPVVLAGFRAESIVLFGSTIDLGWLSMPLTLLWLLGCINAVNLLDGMDGLASIVGMASALTLGFIAACTGNAHVTVAAVALAGALAGFLVHNRPPAAIFLGDSGSMVIGLVLGLLGIQATLKTSTTLSITTPLVVMTFPMFDTFLALVRRRLTGRPFDAADREHIHHRLLDRGMSPWVVLGIIGALCLATGVAAAVATIVRRDLLAWLTALTLVVLVVRLRLFGDHEWRLATGAAARAWAAFREARRGPPAALPCGREHLSWLSPAEVWAALVDRARAWNVSQLRLTLGRTGQATWRHLWTDPDAQSDESGWALAVSVTGMSGWTCEVRAEGPGDAEAEFVSPAGLVRLLTAFASHFADHAAQVFELAASETAEQGASWEGQERRSRAA